MALRITSIELCNFRNYRRFALEDVGQITLLVGPNAVGKTNVVEAVQLLTAAASFRHPKIAHVIKEGESSGRASLRLNGDARDLEVSLFLADGRRSYQVNGKAKRPSDIRGTMPSVVFTPDDLSIVKGGNSGRRALLDALGSQLSANHDRIKKDYDQIIRSKNKLLKDEADSLMVESVNELVVRVGAQLTCYRAALFTRMMPYLASHYAALTSGVDELTARYVPSWVMEGSECRPESASAVPSREEARSCLSRALSDRSSEERARRKAVVGPHADRIEFFIDGKDAALFASQGQQRSVILAEKLSEVSLIEDVLGKRPVLLLDDVMSELDASRRAALVDHIDTGLQTFITTTNLSYFDGDIADRARIVHLARMDGKGGCS